MLQDIANNIYIINGEKMRVEVLAENLANGLDYYFLRGVDRTNVVEHILASDLPEPYIPNYVEVLKGAIYVQDCSLQVAGVDMTIDTNAEGTFVPRDSNTGAFLTHGYISINGLYGYCDRHGRFWNLAYRHYSLDDKFCQEESCDIVTWCKLETDALPIKYEGIDGHTNRKNLEFSDFSDSYALRNSDDWAVEDGKTFTKEDLAMGLVSGYAVCSECGKIEDEGEMSTINGEWVCQNCLENEFVWSDHQQDYIRRDYATWVEYVDSYVDDETLNDEFERCQCCDEYCLSEDMCTTDDNYTLCECCYANETQNGYYDSENGFIEDYDYRPTPTFFGGDQTKYLGLEWEIDGGGENGYIAQKIFGDVKEVYCKHDGSLDAGFEVVTHPCTPEYMLNLPWANWCNQVLDEGYDNRSGVGIHIHVSRRHFTGRSAIGRLVRFFAENYNDMRKFAARSESSAREWANYACIDEDFTDEDCYEASMDDKYYAVNVLHNASIEIRIFATAYKPQTIKAYIQMVDVLSDLANGEYCDFTFANIRKEAENRGYAEMVSRLDYYNL